MVRQWGSPEPALFFHSLTMLALRLIFFHRLFSTKFSTDALAAWPFLTNLTPEALTLLVAGGHDCWEVFDAHQI